jgi:signal transduction histidine kinase
MVDTTEYTILILDQFGRVRQLNQAARSLLKNNYEEIVGCKVDNISSSPPLLKIVELVSNTLETHSSSSCHVHDELRGNVWEITAIPVIGQTASMEQIVIVARDVTQKQRSDLMAIAGALIVSVAHQVRNPLFGISSALDVLEALFGDREEYQAYFTVLRREVQSLSELMQELLEYSKPPIQELSPGIIEDVIAHAINSCIPLAEQSGIEIISHIQRGLAPILMDKKHLAQAFVNLLENAIQHSRSGGAVMVEVKETHINNQHWIECSVKDNGPGFPQGDLHRVFEPFFTRRRGGTGLGLPIAQRVIAEHGGNIWAGNRSEGGAIIKCTLRSVAADQKCTERFGSGKE